MEMHAVIDDANLSSSSTFFGPWPSLGYVLQSETSYYPERKSFLHAFSASLITICLNYLKMTIICGY